MGIGSLAQVLMIDGITRTTLLGLMEYSISDIAATKQFSLVSNFLASSLERQSKCLRKQHWRAATTPHGPPSICCNPQYVFQKGDSKIPCFHALGRALECPWNRVFLTWELRSYWIGFSFFLNLSAGVVIFLQIKGVDTSYFSTKGSNFRGQQLYVMGLCYSSLGRENMSGTFSGSSFLSTFRFPNILIIFLAFYVQIGSRGSSSFLGLIFIPQDIVIANSGTFDKVGISLVYLRLIYSLIVFFSSCSQFVEELSAFLLNTFGQNSSTGTSIFLIFLADPGLKFMCVLLRGSFLISTSSFTFNAWNVSDATDSALPIDDLAFPNPIFLATYLFFRYSTSISNKDLRGLLDFLLLTTRYSKHRFLMMRFLLILFFPLGFSPSKASKVLKNLFSQRYSLTRTLARSPISNSSITISYKFQYSIESRHRIVDGVR